MLINVSTRRFGRAVRLVGGDVSRAQRRGRIEVGNLTARRNVAREIGFDLHDILDERVRLWPTLMCWEAAFYIAWTHTPR